MHPEQYEMIRKLYFENYSALKVYAMLKMDQNDDLAQEAVLDVYRLILHEPQQLLECQNPRVWLFNALNNRIGQSELTEYDTSCYDNMDDEALKLLLQPDYSTKPEQAMDVCDILSLRQEKSPAAAEKGWKELSCHISHNLIGKKGNRKWWIINASVLFALISIIGWMYFDYIIDADESSQAATDESQIVVLTDGFTTLQEALLANNQKSDFVPTWIPDRYVLDAIKMIKNPKSTEYSAMYLCGTDSMQIRVIAYINSNPIPLSADGSLTEYYYVSGIEYCFYDNNNEKIILWETDSYSCMIQSNAKISELKYMIDSITRKTAA